MKTGIQSRFNDTRPPVEIGGRHWQGHTGGIFTRDLAPGEIAPNVAQVTTPHPDPILRAVGWRLAWIFFALACPFACMVMLFWPEVCAVLAR